MDDNLESLVQVMYSSCQGGLDLKKYGNSLLFYLFRSSANSRSEALRKSEEVVLTSNEAECLKNLGLIRNGPSLGHYVLTAKGVWFCEKDIIGNDVLIDLIDRDYFKTLSKEEHLSDKLKVVLAVAIASRTYSKQALISMRVEDDLRDRWWGLFQEMSTFLHTNCIIKTDPINTYKSSSSIEDRSSDIIRHTDSMPRLTRSIFSKTGKNGYYLDIMDESGVPVIERLAYVINVVFEDNLNVRNIEDIARYMILFFRKNVVEIAYSTFEEQYGDISYDQMIHKAFYMAMENRGKLMV